MLGGHPGEELEVGRVLRPGPGSMEGLIWLARVGPCPFDAWRAAMGWSEVAARSHARRLETEGWLTRHPMIRGDGYLFQATKTGAKEIGAEIGPVRTPHPLRWDYYDAVSWTAAWFKLAHLTMLTPREVAERPEWAMEITWPNRRRGPLKTIHRPDLVGFMRDGTRVTIELRFVHTPADHLAASVLAHSTWQTREQEEITGYVCTDDDDCDEVIKQASAAGLLEEHGTLIVKTLDSVRSETLKAYNARSSVKSHRLRNVEHHAPKTQGRTYAT
jgi:hypothetical protein